MSACVCVCECVCVCVAERASVRVSAKRLNRTQVEGRKFVRGGDRSLESGNKNKT